MKLSIKILAILFVLTGLFSCNNNNNDNNSSKDTFKATLIGASETPPNASAATGTATLVYNTSSKKFTITVTYSGLTATLGHVHKGAVGVAGPPVFTFGNLTSPIVYTSPELSTEQIADLYANLYYVNLHSVAFPDGEIRGQLLKQTGGGGGGGGPY